MNELKQHIIKVVMSCKNINKLMLIYTFINKILSK